MPYVNICPIPSIPPSASLSVIEQLPYHGLVSPYQPRKSRLMLADVQEFIQNVREFYRLSTIAYYPIMIFDFCILLL